MNPRESVPAHPLQSLIAAAAKTPARTGVVGRYSARLDGSESGRVVILCDTSGSMSEHAGSRRKIEHLREAVAWALDGLPGAALIAFDSVPRPIPSAAALPEPSGSTALERALDSAAGLRPEKTVVISDGLPDSESTALAAAERLPGLIDVIFVGPEDDAAALGFMRRLARAGGGVVVTCDLVRQGHARALAAAVRRAALPAPTGGRP